MFLPNYVIFSSVKNTSSLILNFISYIIIFTMVVIAAYLTAKILGKKNIKMMRGKNIQVVEKMNLGLDKSLLIIKIGESFYLLSSGKQKIELITTLKNEDVKLTESVFDESGNMHSFDAYYKKLLKRGNEKSIGQEGFLAEEQDLSYEQQDSLVSILNEFKLRSQTVNKTENEDEIE